MFEKSTPSQLTNTTHRAQQHNEGERREIALALAFQVGPNGVAGADAQFLQREEDATVHVEDAVLHLVYKPVPIHAPRIRSLCTCRAVLPMQLGAAVEAKARFSGA